MIINYIYIFIIGVCIGSFLNVCIFRIPNGESIINPPSHCGKCGQKIKFYDLIPIVSWVFLKGKCRNCGSKISAKYIMVETFTGIMFLVYYKFFGLSLTFLKFIFMYCIGFVIAIIDLRTTDVYFSLSVFGSITGIIFIILTYINVGFSFSALVKDILMSLACYGLFYALYKITHGFGDGDCEIVFLLSLFLGWKNSLLMVLMSFILGGVIGLLLIASKIKGRKDMIPFGPFLVLSAVICSLWGEKIIKLYMQMFT